MYAFELETQRDIRIIKAVKSEGAAADGFASLKHRMAEVLEGGCRKVVLDMVNVDFVESRGLGILVGALRQVQEVDALLILCNIAAPLAAVLQAVNFLKLFPIRINREQAIDSLAKVSPRKGMNEKLMEGNPSVTVLKSGPPERAVTSSDMVTLPKRTGSVPEIPKAEKIDGEPSGRIPTASPLAPNKPSDWENALSLYSDLRVLCSKHGIECRPETNFRDVFALLAERLASKR